MLANLQKNITSTLLLAACGWFLYFYSSAFFWAVSGFFFIVFGYTGVLAIEFLFLIFINKADPTPQATWKELFLAWLSESLTTPQVFFWRQAFRANDFPDVTSPSALVQGHRGVVFVHGFFCNRGFWAPWLKRLQGRGHAYVALNLEPIFGSIDDYVSQIDEAVECITQSTGLTPLLVCHSMGGLVARAWLKTMKSEGRVHHVVTIGTPHRGTWLARFGQGENSKQMRLRSDWQVQLDQDMPKERHALFTCWYSNSDNIVAPASNATLPGADNRLVRGAGHVQLAFLPEIMTSTLAMLDKLDAPQI